MEFGEPYLEVREPMEPSIEVSERTRRILLRRNVAVHGEWHLWIYCCNWRLYTGKRLMGHAALDSRSRRPIQRAARELDGQEIVKVELDVSRGASTFHFDLESRLETEPYEGGEQWMFFRPESVISYWADGTFTEQPRSGS
jgi:hypothetical protein